MPFWEEHKKIVCVIAGFLGLLFLCWLFLLRGYAYESGRSREDYEKKIKAGRDKLCPERGQKVEILKLAFNKANAKLEAAVRERGDKLAFKFPARPIPREQLPHRQLFVRNEYSKLQEYTLKEVESNRRIKLADGVDKLGLVIPDQYSEDLAQDLRWLRQMAVIRRILDMLMRICEEKDATRGNTLQRNLLEIRGIKPAPPDKTGTEDEKFILEYPVELDVVISLRGLMRLLRLCSMPATFHVVRSLTILSGPSDRRSTPQQRRVNPTLMEKWYVHYYRVQLTLAAITIVEARVKPKASPSPHRQAKIIPH